VPSFTRNWLVKRGPGRLPVAPMQRFDKLSLLSLLAALLLWVILPMHAMTGAVLRQLAVTAAAYIALSDNAVLYDSYPQQLFAGLEKYGLIAIPLFMRRHMKPRRVRIRSADSFRWSYRYRGLTESGLRYDTGHSLDEFRGVWVAPFIPALTGPPPTRY